jgi:hypothetical protein
MENETRNGREESNGQAVPTAKRSTPWMNGNQFAAGKGAGKRGNRNSMKAGLFAIASLPKGASYIRRLTAALRREVENAVREKLGEISLYHSALAQAAARHECRALLCQRWLRLHSDTMTHTERLSYLDAIGRATDARNRSLKEIGLDRKDSTAIFDALYAPPSRPEFASDSESPSSGQTAISQPDATESVLRDSTGGAA